MDKKIILVLNDGTEYELLTEVRADGEFKLYVSSYTDCIEKLGMLTRQNLSGYKVTVNDNEIYENTQDLDVEYARFPQLYEKVEETDVIVMFIKLRKAIG